jgi:hypothetical protein
VVDAYEEEVVEDGADVEGPMQEHLEEDFGHEEDGDFDPELDWQYFVVVVEDQQDFTCFSKGLPMPKAESP